MFSLREVYLRGQWRRGEMSQFQNYELDLSGVIDWIDYNWSMFIWCVLRVEVVL